nr:reverse transcriptase domain-containing protein [Tanacetum cinerariifolium]
MERFKIETGRMKGAPECMRISGFMHGINNPELIKRLNEHVPKTMKEMMIATTAFIRGEAAAASKKKGHESWKPQDQPKKHADKRPDFRGHPRDDGGSSMEILYEHYFNRLRSEIKSQMVPATTSLTGFSGETTWPLGQLRLLVTIGDITHSTYNGIIGRPGLKAIQAVPSTVHGMLKFPSKEGIITIRSSLLIPAECTSIDTLSPIPREKETRPTNLTNPLHPNFPDQEVVVGGSLSDKGRTEFCALLKKNLDIFAWQPSNMTGHDGSWRMCVDFTDLNKACPHDCYPLPEIDWKVESLCEYPFKCFLDAYKGYHQIQLATADEEKTAFHTRQGVYCYTKMPFGLKNAGATYQRLMDKAFESQMERNIEVYVDDLVVKSHTEAKMLRDIEETFQTLRKINMKLNLKNAHSDGSSCVEGSGIGLILTNPDGVEFTYALRFQFAASNNEAEYEALIAGTYVAKENNMIKYLDITKGLVSGFKTFSISQVPRSRNKKADALSKIASTSFAHLSNQVLVEVLETKSIIGKEVTAVIEEEGPTWMTKLVNYLKEGILPGDENEARKLRLKARQYEFIEGILYKRPFLTPWLRCVGPLQAEYVMKEMHEGSCSMHAGPRPVVAKAIRLGYFWPTMHKDAHDMIRKCSDCQIHRPVTRHPQQPLTSITASWPFYKWGINIACPFPEGPGKVKFLIVAMDYFTKWIEAKAIATITGEQMKKFIWDNIVCRFGIPGEIISDNGKQFADNPFKDWCNKLNITQRFTSVKHPQSNGLVERVNRSLEEVIPAEIGMPTYRTTAVDVVNNNEELHLNLDLLEERRELAAMSEARSKSKMMKYYNSRVRGVAFKPGDFFYRSNDASHAVAGGKLGPKWEGPYEVTDALGNGAYKLWSTDGTVLPKTWNVTNLKRCYL